MPNMFTRNTSKRAHYVAKVASCFSPQHPFDLRDLQSSHRTAKRLTPFFALSAVKGEGWRAEGRVFEAVSHGGHALGVCTFVQTQRSYPPSISAKKHRFCKYFIVLLMSTTGSLLKHPVYNATVFALVSVV